MLPMNHETSELGARIGVFSTPQELKVPDVIPDNLADTPVASLSNLDDRRERGLRAQKNIVVGALATMDMQPYFVPTPDGDQELYAVPPATSEQAGQLAVLLYRKFNHLSQSSWRSRRPIPDMFTPDSQESPN